LSKIHFCTFTLRTNRAGWLTIDALEEHWQPATAEAELTSHIELMTKNVAALTINLDSGDECITDSNNREIKTESSIVKLPAPRSDRSMRISLHKQGNEWVLGPLPVDGLRKKHGLQGPIDDAFMDSFIFVRPTGIAANEKAGVWAKAELDRAIEHWRRHFRGDARVKDDVHVTDADVQTANLVLWGDPQSNKLMARLFANGADAAATAKLSHRLPVTWTAGEVTVGEQSFPADHHALVCIYPNPLNPERYVVLNSSFTFREYDYLNNARQTPKLPDWAVIDLDTPPDSRRPGRIAAADFFGERWEVK
jgi:hypothetical protein